MKPQIFTLSLTLALAALATAARAEQVCMTADEMRAGLIDWYGEAPVSVTSPEREQIWASPETGTWTMIKLKPGGMACVLAKGEDWTGTDGADALLAQLD